MIDFRLRYHGKELPVLWARPEDLDPSPGEIAKPWSATGP